jgi:hypothetical protein
MLDANGPRSMVRGERRDLGKDGGDLREFCGGLARRSLEHARTTVTFTEQGLLSHYGRRYLFPSSPVFVVLELQVH